MFVPHIVGVTRMLGNFGQVPLFQVARGNAVVQNVPCRAEQAGRTRLRYWRKKDGGGINAL